MSSTSASSTSSSRFRLSLTEQDATIISDYLSSPELAGLTSLPQPLAVRKFIVKLAEFLDRISSGNAVPVGIPATSAPKYSDAELQLIEAIKLEAQLGVTVGAQAIAEQHSLDYQHYLNLVTTNSVD